MDISIIIVSYNTRQILAECLNSVIQQTQGLSYEIIVIDNASVDGSVEMLRQEFPGIIVKDNRENRGFSSANNQGIAIARGDFVFFLNPDTILLNNAAKLMMEFIETQKDAGFVGPALYYQDGRYQPSIGVFSSPLHVLYLYMPFTGFIHNLYYKYLFSKDKIRNVDWLCGAALLVRRAVLQKVGGFDENFFMYSEEEDLCLRMKKNGYRLFYFPAAKIIHLKGQSSLDRKSQSNHNFWVSKIKFFKKHYSASQIALFKSAFILVIKIKKHIFGKRKDYFTQIEKILKDKL